MDPLHFPTTKWNDTLGVDVGAKVTALLEEVTKWEFRLQPPVRRLNRNLKEIFPHLGMVCPPILTLRLGELRRTKEQIQRSFPCDIGGEMLRDLERHVGRVVTSNHEDKAFTPFNYILTSHCTLWNVRDLNPTPERYSTWRMVEAMLNPLSFNQETWGRDEETWLEPFASRVKQDMARIVTVAIEILAVQQLHPARRDVRLAHRVIGKILTLCLDGSIPLGIYADQGEPEWSLLVLTF